MTITPTGSPIWTGASSHEAFGGHTEKRNHLGQGVVDPETDVSAEQLARMATDFAAVARVAPFAVLDITCNDTSPAAPTINSCLMNTGIRTASYEGDAAPTGFPSAARVATGRFTLQFASTYSDDYSTSASFVVRPGLGSHAQTTGGTVAVIRDGDTTLTVRAFTAAGVADSDARVTVVVFAGGSN